MTERTLENIGAELVLEWPNATDDGWEQVNTHLGGGYDPQTNQFIIPFGDAITAEECLRIVGGTVKRAMGE